MPLHTLRRSIVVGTMLLVQTNAHAQLSNFVAAQTIDPSLWYISTHALGDLNEDGVDDLVLGLRPNLGTDVLPRLEIYYNNGHGQFIYQQTIQTSFGNSPGSQQDYPTRIRIADLRWDERNEIAYVTADYAGFRFVGNPLDTSFNQYVFYPVLQEEPNDFAFGNINNDGIPDIVFSSWWGRRIEVLTSRIGPSGSYSYQPDQSFDSRQFSLDNPNPTSIDLKDFNGDGLDDLIYLNSTGSFDDPTPDNLVICPNISGILRTHHFAQYFSVGHRPISAKFFDLDEDGDLDIVTSSYREVNGIHFTSLNMFTNTLEETGVGSFIDEDITRVVTGRMWNPVGVQLECDSDEETLVFTDSGPFIDNGGYLRAVSLNDENEIHLDNLLYYDGVDPKEAVPSDIDGDGDTDFFMTTLYANSNFGRSIFNRCQGPLTPADMNADGRLNVFDFNIFFDAYTNQESIADLGAPLGAFHFFDISAFINAIQHESDELPIYNTGESP